MLEECASPGCTAIRRTVNHWYVVHKDLYGVHLYEWDKCPVNAMKEGKHFCGHAHMMQFVSNVMTPDRTDAKRESTLELRPPLTREGKQPPNMEQEDNRPGDPGIEEENGN